MADPDFAVIFQNACKSYGRGNSASRVLTNFSMAVPKGSIYGLLGSSGCGKTTVLGCIAGRLKLDSGEVEVLGGTPGTKGSGIPGPRIGYMPQDVSLAGEFNVKNIFYYFGWMFGMSNTEIAERHQFLSKLLELPTDDRLITSLSGGQQRRVSLAAALVQTPDLLLLDEPTVGLDPILRQSIWDYLVEISRDRNMTIIITTHYIEEAMQAHKIGLLREGVLLADAAPQVVIAQHHCSTLEEVFLMLSSKQENERVDVHQRAINGVVIQNGCTDSQVTSTVSNTKVNPTSNGRHVSFDETSSDKIMLMERRPIASFRSRMKALLYKNFLTLIRNHAGLVFLLLFPVFELCIFFTAIGNDATGVPLGIVNDEYSNCSKMLPEIRNSSGTMIYYDELGYRNCHYHGLSCLFIDMIENKKTQNIIFYKDQETAYIAAKRTRTQSILYFPSNFSLLLEERFNGGSNFSQDVIGQGEIKAWLDMSDYLVGYQVKKMLYDVYGEFADHISDGCNRFRKISRIPMKFNKPVYSSSNESYRDFMAPGVVLLIAYFLSAVITGTNITAERANGLWDRNLVAGATVAEIIMSHILCNVVGLIIQTTEILLVAFYVYNMECKGSIAVVILIVGLQSFAGICYGILVSSVSPNTTASTYFVIGTFFPVTLISGVMWPIESIDVTLRYISYFTPGTLASMALGNVLIKGLSVLDKAVLPGVLMSMAWIVLPYVLSVFFLRRK